MQSDSSEFRRCCRLREFRRNEAIYFLHIVQEISSWQNANVLQKSNLPLN